MVVVVQGCPVCGPDLNPLGCAGRYGTGRHANGGESHGNQQQSTHQCFHLLIVTIANKIGFGCFVLILQKVNDRFTVISEEKLENSRLFPIIEGATVLLWEGIGEYEELIPNSTK